MLIAGTDVPVVPYHLRGTFEAMPPHAKWPRRAQIVLRIGSPSRFMNIPNERSGWQTIGQTLERSVRALCEETGA
jgi:hypothetical protein